MERGAGFWYTIDMASFLPLILATVCACGVAPERANDFFWENDKVGFRAYGPGDPHVWSGIDLFNKMTDAGATCGEVLHNHDTCGNWHVKPWKGILDNYIKAGSLAESNDRVINQLIVYPVLAKVAGGGCNQLQMGLTELKPGSVWNTMPQHTHARRMEAYFYFNVPAGQAICHQMGEPQEQRLLWLHDEQAVASPEWSVHSAAGPSNYMFIWGMGGENLNYGDMDKVPLLEMR